MGNSPPIQKAPGKKSRANGRKITTPKAAVAQPDNDNIESTENNPMDTPARKKSQSTPARKAANDLASPSNVNRRSGNSGAVSAGDNDNDGIKMEAVMREFATMKAALQKADRENEQLQRLLSEINTPNMGAENIEIIEKPSGSSWSIQQAMGLHGRGKKYEKYKSLQRSIRDLTMAAQISWEVPWAAVPAQKKAMLFEVCRDQHPYLARFRNDWATEAIAKQFTGNKRQHAYDEGWLEVPKKWAHLKVNASKRTTTGSRNKKALQTSTSKKAVTKRGLAKGKGHMQEWAEERLRFRQESDGEDDNMEHGDGEDDDDDDDDMEADEEGAPSSD